MQAALHAILKRFVKVGRLGVRWPDGSASAYGSGGGPEAALRLKDAKTIRLLLLTPALSFGEAYMDGTLEPEGCSIYDLMDLVATNVMATGNQHPLAALQNAVLRAKRRFDQYNPAPRAQRNVAHHYDLNGRLYSLFLDRDRQYSCAYFRRGDETLEEAQIAKKRHIAAKLLLDRPGLKVLDIGSGWGGLALTLAREYGAIVLGVTLSKEQLAESRARADAEGLTDRVRFEPMDYRAVHERFDRIVSVGMFEHVGVGHYREFFDTVARCLEHDGVALLHAIGRNDVPGFTNPWIDKYIFPGGYCPALS
ncbi:MAG: class I SAM-dependent methyltransferase, partial [Acetobacteraceae bacterium]|nr:class I SAM-dependent methyltransferase [Acetobacteraceae bacterium]